MSNKMLVAGVTLACFTMLAPLAFAHGGEHHPSGEKKSDGLQIGGFHDFQVVMPDQDVGVSHGKTWRDVAFANQTQIHLTYTKSSDAGLNYGAVVQLQADASEPDHQQGGFPAHKSYLFLECEAGKTVWGSEYDAAHLMEVNASTFARATGGIHGDWEKYSSMPHQHADDFGVINPDGHFHEFLLSPSMPIAHAHGEAQIANKASYFTPVFGGVQGGISFTPDSGDTGTVAGSTGTGNLGQFENVVDAVLTYTQEFGAFSVATSISGEFAESERPLLNDIAAYAAGLNLGYGGFTVGGSYGNWGDSSLITTYTADDATYWNIGFGYEHGAWGVSLGYLESTYNDNEASVTSVGADYTLAPGLVPYVEVNFFTLDHTTATDNKGTVVLAGVGLSF